MRCSTFAMGLALLAAAVPAAAQERGTIEFGAFGARNSFDKSLGLKSSMGGGLRVGAFLAPSLSLEFEGAGSKADRTLGRSAVNVGILSARVTAVPLRMGRLSILVGAGFDHTDTHFLESYGYHGLLGAKYAFSEAVALRVDGIGSKLMNGDATNTSLRLGLSVYRKPLGRVDTVTVTRMVPAEPLPAVMRPDSVSAAETARLRQLETNYRALRDSLGRTPPPRAAVREPWSRDALATMQAVIYFPHDRSDLNDAATAVLRDKVAIFRAEPTMRILIVGFASQPGTPQYNLALGRRRAEAAKRYLVAQGVDAGRIEITSSGENDLVDSGTGTTADAANRRAQFRLLMADPYAPTSGRP